MSCEACYRTISFNRFDQIHCGIEVIFGQSYILTIMRMDHSCAALIMAVLGDVKLTKRSTKYKEGKNRCHT